MKKNHSKQRKKTSRNKSSKNKPGSTRIVLLVTIAIIAIVAIGATGLYLANREPRYDVVYPDGSIVRKTLSEMQRKLDRDEFYQGIFINDVDVSGMSLQAVRSMFDDNPQKNHQEISIVLDVDGNSYPLDFSGETLESNLQEIITEAYSYARVGEGETEAEQYVDRYQKLLLIQAQPIHFNAAFTLELAVVENAVYSSIEHLNKEVKNAEIVDFDTETLTFVIEECIEGFQLDLYTAVNMVKSTLDSNVYEAVIEVLSYVEYPEVTKEMLEESMGLISTTSSSTTNDPPRNNNIRLVCETINGTIVLPGESFNFNEHVGQRTSAAGYQEAGGIYDGVLRQEIGGGICQPNTMLFHSVVKADLQVDIRSPHSWPSSYVPVGTDAAVSWGGPEFQFTNTSDYPIAIYAHYEDRVVTVAIYGHQLPDGITIEFIGVVNSVTPSTDVEYIADEELPIGSTEVERDARDSISATSYKVYYDSEGEELYRERAFSSFYPIIRARIRVGLLNPDGTFSTLDKDTGEVITPEPTEEPSPTPTEVPEITPDPTPEITPDPDPQIDDVTE